MEEEEESPLETKFEGLGYSTDLEITVAELRQCWNEKHSQKSHGPALIFILGQ